MTLMWVKPVYAIYDPLSVPNNKYGIHILEPSEVEKAKEFVNSGGGEWGYVTIPIRANDRNLEKWTEFMVKSRQYKVIPILRIASFPVDDHWMAPNDYDLLDFANFLDQLPWPTKNRYIIVYNEPNHAGEWGGYVYPEEYARILNRAVDIFRQLNGDFFIIAAGLDSSQTNIYSYFKTMKDTVPEIFNKVDGLSFHTYGNPAFATPPNVYSKVNIGSYRYELRYLTQLGVDRNKPIFLTETGWKNPADWYFEYAFNQVWVEENIVAVTPFLLNGGEGPFKEFNFIDNHTEFKGFAKKIIALTKVPGRPLISELKESKPNKFIQINSLIPTSSPVSEQNIFEKLYELLRLIFG